MQARVAARLFVGDLARAEHDIKRIIGAGRWPDNMPTYSREVEVWEARRHEFAAVANVTQWTLVAVAFQDLLDLSAIYQVGHALSPADRRTLDAVRRRIDDAYEIALHWAAPRWQRRAAMSRISEPRSEHAETDSDVLRRVVRGQRDDREALRAVVDAIGATSEAAAQPLAEVELDDVADAIAKLPEREKLVVALTFYEGLPRRDVAEMLGVPEASVEVLTRRALRRLHDELAPSQPDES